MGKSIVMVAILVGLAGCVGPEQRAAQMQVEVDTMIKVYGPACERLGYKADDDKWRECVMRLSARDDLRYRMYPTTSSCWGHRGFFNCSTF